MYAGVAAAVVSIAAALAIRFAPNTETAAATVHLLLNTLLYATAGALVARLGAAGWRAGMFAALVDALIGHAIAFLIIPAPDASRVSLPAGMEATPGVLASMHLFGAMAGAALAVVLGLVAGAVGGWAAGRARRSRA